MRRESRPGRSEAVETETVAAATVGSAVAVAVVAAETETPQALTRPRHLSWWALPASALPALVFVGALLRASWFAWFFGPVTTP